MDHMASLFLVFGGTSILFVQCYTNVYSHQQSKRVFFTPNPLQHLLFVVFNDSHSDQCALVPHCTFDLHGPNNS